MALKDDLLKLVSRYTGGRVGYDGGGTVSTSDILDGMSASDMTRDLRSQAGPDVRRRLQDKAMRGIPLSPLEHEQLRMYVERDLPQRREIKSQELGLEDAARFAMGMIPDPRVVSPREGAEPAGPDIRAQVRNRALAGRPLPGDEEMLSSYIENDLPGRRERAANSIDEWKTAGNIAHEVAPFVAGPAGAYARPMIGRAVERAAEYAAPLAKPALMATPLAALFAADAGDAQAQQRRAPAAAPASGEADKEAVMNLQRELQKQGYYQGPIDGRMEGGTRAAAEKRTADQAAAEERRIRLLEAETKGEQTKIAGKKVEDDKAKREKGEKRLKEITDTMPWYQTALRDYGPVIGNVAGFGLGMWSKGMAGKATERASEKAASRADKLMDPVATDLPQRVGNVNQFWGEGQRAMPVFGSREVPFLSDPTAMRGFRANSAAPPAADLYQPNKMGQYGRDAAVLGVYGTEYGVGEFRLKEQAQTELEAARTAVRDDPSEANISRLVKAQNSAGIADIIANMGRMGAITHGGMLVKSGGPQHTRPDVAKAEAERIRIDSLLAKKPPAPGGNAPPTPPPGAGPQPPPIPPTLPPGTSLTAPAAPLPPAQNAPKMPPPLPAVTPAPQTAVNLPVSSKAPANLPEGHIWVDAGRGSKVKGPDGRWTEMGVVAQEPAATKLPKGKQVPKTDVDDDVAGFVAGKPVPKKPDPELNEEMFKGRRDGGRLLDMARRYANGGGVLPPGLVAGPTPGRADALDVEVPNGAYVVPADCVSGIKGADNNTEAGAEIWRQMLPKPSKNFAAGGVVPIKISHGEIVISPDQVAAIGGGDLQQGHRVLDQMIKRIREDNIHHLASLPPPAQS